MNEQNNIGVLLSINTKPIENILAGLKEWEIRKTRPKLEPPFTCYIYATKRKSAKDYLIVTECNNGDYNHSYYGNGKVIGEFICDNIMVFGYDEHIGYPTPAYEGDESFLDCGPGYWITVGDLEKTGLTGEEFNKYGNGKDLYGLHISNLVIYDEPKELNEFRKPCLHLEKCEECKRSINQELPFGEISIGCDNVLLYSPQSWCYVEVLK